MNIFVLDKNPQNAAIMMCNKHVVKMIVETAQMLCTVIASQGHETPYRPTHKNHPCTLWAGKSTGNWNWLVDHGMALCREYTHRYGKIHKTQSVSEWCAQQSISFPSLRRTAFAQAMPPQYKNIDPVKAYRDYYKGEKSYMAKWKLGPPTWWGKA